MITFILFGIYLAVLFILNDVYAGRLDYKSLEYFYSDYRYS